VSLGEKKMLIKRLSDADHFVTEKASTVTVNPALLNGAANEVLIERNNRSASRIRRLRRQSSPISGQVGGWKVRMW